MSSNVPPILKAAARQRDKAHEGPADKRQPLEEGLKSREEILQEIESILNSRYPGRKFNRPRLVFPSA